MICIKTQIPEEICKIDDELKAIYHSNDSVCIWPHNHPSGPPWGNCQPPSYGEADISDVDESITPDFSGTYEGDPPCSTYNNNSCNGQPQGGSYCVWCDSVGASGSCVSQAWINVYNINCTSYDPWDVPNTCHCQFHHAAPINAPCLPSALQNSNSWNNCVPLGQGTCEQPSDYGYDHYDEWHDAGYSCGSCQCN